MYSDHSIAGRCQNIQEYYDALYQAQSLHHGADYMLVHEEIKKLLQTCESYTELGVNQGTTLCLPLLHGIKTIRAYDMDLVPYSKAKHLFDVFVKERGVDCQVFQTDTLSCTLAPVDLLYIDTKHYYSHLIKELALHGDKAKKYIVFHDTVMGKNLDKAVREYVQTTKKWDIRTDCKKDVGFMTIERKLQGEG